MEVEEPSSKAMVAIDGLGYDWSFMADEEEAPTEMTLMAFSDSEVQKGYLRILVKRYCVCCVLA